MEHREVMPERGGEHYDEQGRVCACAEPEAHLRGAQAEGERTLELHEEELLARKEMRELGEVVIRTEVEEVPGRLEVDAYREELQVEHVPIGQVVSERAAPWEEDGVLVLPVYEEQLVVVKRLVMKEQLRVRRVGVTERQLFEDTLRRERLVVEDPDNTGLVVEHFPTDEAGRPEEARGEGEGLLDKVVRKALL